MNKLLLKLFHFSIGSLGTAILNLLLIPITTHYLTPSEYGKTSMFFLAQTMLIYIIYLGFDQAFTREYYKAESRTGLLLNAMLVPLLNALFLIVMMVLGAPRLSKWLFNDAHYTLAIYLLAGSILFLIFERFTLLYLRMEKQALFFSLYNILVKLVILLMTVGFLIVFPSKFIYAVYGSIIGQILGDLLLIIGNRRIFQFNKMKFNSSQIKDLWNFGFPIAISTFVYSLFVVIDKLFLRYFTDFYQLGLYTAAFKIASALMIIQISFSNFWVPTAYEWFEESKEIRYYKWVSDTVMFILSVLFVLLLLFKDLVVFILSPEYSGAAAIFPFLCFYPIMMTVSETTTLGIVFTKKSYLNILVSFFSLLASIFFNLVLTPFFGAVGTAIATGTSYVVFFGLRTYFSMRVWQGFSIKKHLQAAALLYLLAFGNLLTQYAGYYRFVLLAALVLLLFLYRSLLRDGYVEWQKWKKERMKI